VTRGRKILVAGSCWPEDDNVLLPAFIRLLHDVPDALLIHVPHEPTEEQIRRLERALTGKASFCLYSSLDSFTNENILIVDAVGKLLPLYAVARAAFVGGSFRQGIHNVLEPAVYGIPVLFGPRHYNSQEPLLLVERGGAVVVEDADALLRTLRHLFADDLACTSVGHRAEEFVSRHGGATARVTRHVLEDLRVHPSRAELRHLETTS
jgi:3-deoxy-D-manno-octulosonic-acid transferase